MYNLYDIAEVEFSRIKEIGQEGRNSRAYIVHDKYLDTELVVKEIPRTSFCDEGSYFGEARLLYKAAHANVVKVQYACACSENIYLALPYYQNGSLKSYAENNSLTMRDIIRFSIQICTGLHHIHSKGLIHFDIKSDNILLSDRYEALISDFGLSKAMGIDFTASPEQVYGKHVTPEFFLETKFNSQYDIYQLGLTIYRLIVGDSSFSSQLQDFGDLGDPGNFEDFKNAVLAEAFPQRISLEHVPPRLRSIVEKCLKVDLSERYQSALGVANELSLIDGNLLDWVYTNDNGHRKWHKITPTHEYQLEIGSDGDALAQKKTTQGKWNRIKDSCGNLTTRQIKGFLGDY
ncbi:serine/threonine-protein kinase [Alcaligenes faecalis]|uniref:Serine/threonine protein kinase n=1 Tax=Alcaligenes faecalis TaxID=511 RepID=A0AAE9HCP7_ALCFA|nr:serine/threonine-protein kinase [Alcaligenes faecalis]UPL21866.1 serine/threonine protein kinase [Alcaligenes faecalis]